MFTAILVTNRYWRLAGITAPTCPLLLVLTSLLLALWGCVSMPLALALLLLLLLGLPLPVE